VRATQKGPAIYTQRRRVWSSAGGWNRGGDGNETAGWGWWVVGVVKRTTGGNPGSSGPGPNAADTALRAFNPVTVIRTGGGPRGGVVGGSDKKKPGFRGVLPH